VIRRQFPASTVIGDFEAVHDPKMLAERLRAKPALEANHIIPLDRESDWHRRSQRLLHRCGTPETGESSMHLDNQSRKLVGRDLVMPHIATDDAGDPKEIDPRRRAMFCHCVLPDY
jgi:hypothetical protein